MNRPWLAPAPSFFLAGGLAALLLAAYPAIAAPAVDLLSHRAAYRLSLAKADSGSGLAQVRGGLVLEWRADCDGWLSQQRLGLRRRGRGRARLHL